MRGSSVEAPHLAVPSLDGGDGVNDTADAFLIEMTLKKKKKEKEKKQELVVLMNIPDNQLTFQQRRRHAEYYRSVAAGACLAAAVQD